MLEKLSSISTKTLEPLKNTFNEASAVNLKETALTTSMDIIENMSLENLEAHNLNRIAESNTTPEEIKEVTNNEAEGLTEEQKKQIKEETGWSDETINAISSMKEYLIYKNAGLQEVDINGKKCLVRSDIDWEQKDSMGRTNKERAEAGLSPINKNGETIELHHIGQKNNGSLAELTPDEHRSKENYSILHDTKKESEIDRTAFNNERAEHWQSRSEVGVKNA
jgi:Na+/phosphate symporter